MHQHLHFIAPHQICQLLTQPVTWVHRSIGARCLVGIEEHSDRRELFMTDQHDTILKIVSALRQIRLAELASDAPHERWTRNCYAAVGRRLMLCACDRHPSSKNLHFCFTGKKYGYLQRARRNALISGVYLCFSLSLSLSLSFSFSLSFFLSFSLPLSLSLALLFHSLELES